MPLVGMQASTISRVIARLWSSDLGVYCEYHICFFVYTINNSRAKRNAKIKLSTFSQLSSKNRERLCYVAYMAIYIWFSWVSNRQSN